MHILFLTNNLEITTPLIDWLKKREKITVWQRKLTEEFICVLKPEFVVSYNYKYIIPQRVLKLLPPKKAINLHISLLPWNRGAHPNLWSFLEDTPKGVTIHLIDKGLDTGPILLQKEVFIDEEKHTLESSYKLLHKEIQKLFTENWHLLKEGKIEPRPQRGEGTIHCKRDFEKIKHLLEPYGWKIPIKVLKERYRQQFLEKR